MGYLPEVPPVYPELSVLDYLTFAAQMRGLSSADDVMAAVAATSLEDKAIEPIGALSRGYKQRLGVAQAILHRPQILILDEPSNGLDPTQIHEMRQLIRRLSEHATVILSTHILQEVNALCDRVLILRGGQLVVDESLRALTEATTVTFVTDPDVDAKTTLLEHLRTVEATSVAPGTGASPLAATCVRRSPNWPAHSWPRASRYLALHRKVRILRACLSRSMNIKLGRREMRLDLIWQIARKELLLFFGSPIAYLVLGTFLAITLFVFFWGSAFFARNIADVRPLFEWLPIVLIFLASAVSMRMWSEERRSGTLEYVLTLPVSTTEFVLGKALACWLLIALALAFTLPLPFSISLIAEIDWGPIYAGYLAALLLAFAYLAIGLFVSASTDSQIVSLLVAVALCGSFYMIGAPRLQIIIQPLCKTCLALWVVALGLSPSLEA